MSLEEFIVVRGLRRLEVLGNCPATEACLYHTTANDRLFLLSYRFAIVLTSPTPSATMRLFEASSD